MCRLKMGERYEIVCKYNFFFLNKNLYLCSYVYEYVQEKR